MEACHVLEKDIVRTVRGCLDPTDMCLRLIFATIWNLSGVTLSHASINWRNQYVVVGILSHAPIIQIQ